jgi:hypothetical membrane protein
MTNIFKILQYLWLTAGLFGLGFGIFQANKEGIESAYMFFLVAFIGGMMFMVNRKRAKSWEESKQKESPSTEKKS